MSSPTIGNPASSKRRCQYASRAMNAVHHRAAGVEDLLRVPLRRLLGADRQVVDDDVGLRLLEDPHHVVGLARRLLDDRGQVLADAVVGHSTRDGDARLGDVGELDRVVRLRPDRLGEIDADLALDDVERSDELDIADVIAAEIDVHQPRNEVVRARVLVVLDTLQQRVRTVADADDRDAHRLAGGGAAVAPTVRGGHSFVSFRVEPLGKRPDDELVHVLLALGGATDQPFLQLGRHPQEHRPAFAREAAGATARLERDCEAGGEMADGDVVEAAAGLLYLSRKEPLEGTRHADEDVLATLCYHSSDSRLSREAVWFPEQPARDGQTSPGRAS
jgi:hypothetical protein